MEQFILDPQRGAKEELVSRPRGDGLLPNSRAIGYWRHYFAFGKGKKGEVGLPRQEQLDDWLAPMGPSGPACSYHPRLPSQATLG